MTDMNGDEEQPLRPGGEQASGSALRRLLGPVSLEEFRNTWWEQKPLHINRSNFEHFGDLLSIAAIESLLSTRVFTFPAVQLTDALQTVSVEEYTDDDGRILPVALAHRHHAGASIVLAQVQQLFSPLQSFCNALHSDLGMRCQANAYLSPPGRQGFKPHYDAHDVFVLQVHGQKSFHFYGGGVDLPLPDDRFDTANSEAGVPGDVIHLSAGDTLYIPRGVMHDAVADADHRSLHVTVGVFPLLMHEVLHELVDIAAGQEREFRASLPIGPAASITDDTGLITGVQALLESLGNDAAIERAMARLMDREALATPQAGLSKVDLHRPAGDIDLNSKLRLIPGALLGSSRTSDGLTLRLRGKLLHFAEPMSSALLPVLSEGETAVGELAGLSDAQRLALAAQLLAAGVVDSDVKPC